MITLKEVQLEHPFETYMEFISYVTASVIIIFFVFAFSFFVGKPVTSPISFYIFLVGLLIVYVGSWMYSTILAKHYKENLPDLLRIHDNGWMLARHRGAWLAPAKLNWIFKVEYSTRGYEKKDTGNVWLNIFFTAPDEKYKDYIFRYYLYGVDVDSSKKEKTEELYNYLKNIAEKNVENGLAIPSGEPQKHIGSMQIPSYWNIVSAKINIEEMYKKETGEEPPKPEEGIEWWGWP